MGSSNKEVLKPCDGKKKGFILTRCRYITRSISAAQGSILLSQGLVSCRKRKREVKKDKDPPYLSNDVIFAILLLLPAKVLYDRVRYVCKEWYSMINDPAFVRSHLQLQLQLSSTTVNILYQSDTLQPEPVVGIQKNGSAHLSFTDMRIPLSGRIVGSCHGLVLYHDWTDRRLLYLLNPITKVRVTLPPLMPMSDAQGLFSAVGFDSSGNYKVVHVCGTMLNQEPVKLLIHTVGVDKVWRIIDIESLLSIRDEKRLFLDSPLSIAGFIYWCHHPRTHGFALDVNAEKMYNLSVPEKFSSFDYLPCSMLVYLETGLGFVADTNNKILWELYELTNVKSGKWTKVLDIDSRFQRIELQRLSEARIPRWIRLIFCMKDGHLWGLSFLDKTYSLFCHNSRH